MTLMQIISECRGWKLCLQPQMVRAFCQNAAAESSAYSRSGILPPQKEDTVCWEEDLHLRPRAYESLALTT